MWICLCFVNKFICIIFLDSTYKQYHIVFVFLWLTSLVMIIFRSTHVAANGNSSSFLWLSNISVHICICMYVCIYMYINTYLCIWTWVWISCRSWWWTGRPDMLQSMESQRAVHNWATELNWTDVCIYVSVCMYTYICIFLCLLYPVMPNVWIPEREERRPPRQCNSQKGRFIADSSQGSCRIQRSGAESESPEPKLLHKFIGWAHAVGSWFKRIGQNFLAWGTFPGVSALLLIGKQRSVLSWLVVSRWPDNLTSKK